MAIDSGYTITPISGQNGTNGKDGQNGASVSVQYSVDGTSNWHDTFVSGDKYMRQKVGTGNWSAAMKVVGEDGKDGDDGHTPTITADRSGDTVSIKSDGTEITKITDGADGISLTSKGNWASGTAYKLMDVVYYTTNKTSYVCKKSHTASSSILPTNTTYWTVLAAPGTDGTNGTNGTNATQYYMHFVYCDDTSSGTNYSTTESRKYVGIYTDTTQADASTFDTAKAKSGIVWSKAEGEDGEDGKDGTGWLRVTTAPTAYTTAQGGFTPAFRMSLSTVKTQSGVNNVKVGDIVAYSYNTYRVGYVDSSYVYLASAVSIRGAAGTKTFFSDYARTWTNTNWNTYKTAGYATTWNNSTVEGMRVGDVFVITATLSEQGNITGTVYAQITSVPSAKTDGYYKIPCTTLYGTVGQRGQTGATGTRGTKTFTGTEIFNILPTAQACTITTASTGVTSNTMAVIVGDEYINELTMDVWKCTTAGTVQSSSAARWTYEGRRKKDTDDSNIFRFFCDGKKANYNTAGTNITQTEVEGENPFGTTSKLLKVTRAANTSSNGRVVPYGKTVKIDSSYTYRYACYVKKTNNKFMNYFGFRGYEKVSETVYNSAIRALNGNESTSAYHVSSTNFGTLNRWYLVIGYVTGKDISSAPAESGVYDMVTKKKTSATVTNYRFKDITSTTHSGTLIEYSASAQTPTEEDTTYIYDIRFDKMDGTEPSLHELLYGTETPSIQSTTNQYAQSSSNTTQPTSWSNTPPTATAGYYMWTKTTVTYTDGTTSTSYAVSKNGATGADGRGVTSIVAYTALSTTATKPAADKFTTSVKSLSSTDKYLWRYELTTYTDDTQSGSYDDATVIAVWGDKGDNAVSVTISSDTVDVMCGAGTGTFLGQQTKTITVYATKGNTRITSTITVPSESGGVKFTKTDGTDSANGAITLTLINGGNLGGNATKTASRTITVVADSISFTFVIKINKVSNGAYLGRCSSVPGNTNAITVYTHATTLLDSGASKYALKGDYVSVVSGTNIGKIYQYNDSSWVLDTNTGHQTEAFSDLLMIPDSLPSDSASNQILNRLISTEVLAKRIKSLEVMFNNFVASITADSPSVGDLCISMGKNPKNPADNDHNFIIQSYKTKLSSNKELWHKEFFTKKNGNITDFNVNGKFNPIFGLETFCDIYSGCALEQIPLSGTGLDIYVETDLIYLDGYFYNFNAPSQTKLSIERASFSRGQLVFSNMTSYTNKGELYCVAAYKGNIYVSTSTGFYRFNTSTAEMTLISSSYKPAMMNEIDGKLNISSSIGVIALYNGSSIETHSVSAAYGLCEFSDGIYCASNTYIPTEGGNYSSGSTFYFYNKSFNLLGSKTAIGKTINGKTVSAATAVFAANGILFTSVYFSDRSYKTVVSYNGGDSWETAPINSVAGIKFFSHKSLIVIKGDNDCAYSYDGGRTWNSIPTADYTALNCGESFLVESDDAKFVYILVGDSSDKLNLYRLRSSNLSKNGIVDYNFGSSSGYVKWSNGLLIQWMLVSVSNREVTLPAPFSNSSSYISIGTIRLSSLSNDRTAYCQIGNKSDRTFIVRARMDNTSYEDDCYCFFIGY